MEIMITMRGYLFYIILLVIEGLYKLLSTVCYLLPHAALWNNNNNKNIRLQYILYPWGYTEELPADWKKIVSNWKSFYSLLPGSN